MGDAAELLSPRSDELPFSSKTTIESARSLSAYTVWWM